MRIDDLAQPRGLPLDEPVGIDGETVYLRLHQDGAELGAHFQEAGGGRQLEDAMQLGFQSALEFDAGWALSDDGAVLLLTRWLPDARGWADAQEALAQLLDQLELLRTVAAIATAKPDHGSSREERLIRSKLMRENR